jgi:hypothetical protein
MSDDHEEEEYRGARCPLCFWALYDGDWCQGPPRCPNMGKSVVNPIRMSSTEAIKAINAQRGATGTGGPA